MAVTFDKQKQKWRADYSETIEGKRVRRRKFFLTKSEANSYFARITSQKKKYGEASTFDLDDYHRLKTIEQSLHGVSLEEVVAYYNSLGMIKHSPVLSEAVKEYLAGKDCSAEHKVNLKIYLGKLVDQLGSKQVGSIKAKDIHWVLRNLDYSMVYKNNIRRALVTFYNYCIFNQYAVTNEAEKVPLFKEVRGDIEIISVGNAKKLFVVLEQHYPHLVAYNALRAFAGIRTAHAKSMSWTQINFEEKGIRFDGEGKRVSSFLEGYPDTLWAWLEKYKGQPIEPKFSKETGKVMREHNIICPQNGVRHGFGTYHLAKYKNISLTSLLLMHRGNPRMLFDRYRGITNASHAGEYFEILPQTA